MKTLLIAVSALVLATPALAQMEPAAPGATTAKTPGTTTTETTTTVTPSDPKALIASEFPAYDKDSNGTLDKSEFASWIGALKEKADGKPTPPADLTKFADGAFATADKDQSKTVTLAELQTYLTVKA